MATVLADPQIVGTLVLEFETSTVTTIVERPLPPADAPASVLWGLPVDLAPYIESFGPLLHLTWTVEVAPVPIPASAWLLATALAAVVGLCRRPNPAAPEVATPTGSPSPSRDCAPSTAGVAGYLIAG